MVAAYGATPDARAQQQAQANISVEEIVVTARQREESLQEIPLAITAFSASDIQKAGFRDLGDIAFQSSGIQFNPNMGGPQVGRLNSVIRIRGVNVLNSLPNLQAVSLFVDGVYSLGGAQVLPIQDLERVEIIKGPQSAFFGRNTFAGAINYITKKPSIDEYSGQIDFSGATYDTFDVNVMHTGPLVKDRLGYLLNVRTYNKGSMYTATDGGKLGKQSSKSASLALYAEPTDGLDVKVRAFYQKDDDGPDNGAFIRTFSDVNIGGIDTCRGKTVQGLNAAGQTVTLSPKNFICGRVPNPGETGAPKISSNTSLRPAIFGLVRPGFDGEGNQMGALNTPAARPNFLIEQFINRKFIPGVPTIDSFGMERETLRTSLNANWEFADGYTATLTAGYNDMKVNWLRDFDNTDSESWYTADPQTGEDKSAELRVSSPGEDRFRWIAGATYYKQTFVTNGAGGLAINACFVTCAVGPANFGLSPTNGDKAKVWAGYGALSYDIIVDQLTLDVEFRYMQDERTNTQTQGSGFRDFTFKFKQKTPRVILTYTPTDELTIYGQASRGTLPGIINGLVSICSPDTFLQPYISPITGLPSTASECAQIASQSPGGQLVPNTPAQYLDAAELGIKSSLLDGALNVNLTGYYYKWKNLPFGLTVRYVRDADNPALRDRLPNAFPNTLGFSTSGAAKFKGAELETAYQINDNWDINANLSWNDNKFTRLTLTGAFSTTVYGTTNYDGKVQQRYPKWQGNFSVGYTDQFRGDWNWFVRGDGAYMGKTFTDFANLSTTSPYWLFNSRVGVEKDDLRVELFVRNLLDEDKWA
ncbi:MAG: TonB-dependent receptor, partial [Rhodospirillaceae bacterium]|nr:TonB-dependent receptor [Rhodospirillaceae bacterium]